MAEKTTAKRKSRREPPVNRLTERGSLRAQRTGGGPLMPRADQAIAVAGPESAEVPPDPAEAGVVEDQASTPTHPGPATSEPVLADVVESASTGSEEASGSTATADPEAEQQAGDSRAESRPGSADGPGRSRGRSRWPIPKPPDFSSRGKLELSGERIVKMTLELPVELVDRLSQWELAYATRTGRRVYRERVLDAALASLPERIGDVVTMARSLPPEYLEGTVETVGTRVRASTDARLRLLRPEMRAQRVRDVYQRHVYTAAILRYLDFLDSNEEETSKKERN